MSDKTKMVKSVPSPGQSVMGAYPNSQNQWPADYGQKVSSWPQGNPQAQGQPWNPGYPSQAYGAYSYASYAPHQVPVSTAPAAYASYPPNYPAQAYTQQSYAQPTAAVPQQAAAAPQPYYDLEAHYDLLVFAWRKDEDVIWHGGPWLLARQVLRLSSLARKSQTWFDLLHLLAQHTLFGYK
ncbi:hypothetical protein HPP92_019487 [Vanilla planifolia]|uniref:Uncharacterized protein n=1 Tax=Vanilla planifolia TaxID=51239 RepID=A0A835UKZ9_VANPL|nr:hypothetical protein HPP92_019487 [Vanilla planifolia]